MQVPIYRETADLVGAAWVLPLFAAAIALCVVMGNLLVGMYPRAMAAGRALAACLRLSGIIGFRQRR